MQQKDYQKDFERRDTLGFLVNRAGRMMSSALIEKLTNSGIEIPYDQWGILFMLWMEDGRNQNELAQHIFKDKATITRGLNSLEKMNLVVRVPDSKDKRIKRVYLTHKGREMKDRVLPLAFELTNQAVQDISDQELDVCKRVLRKMFENLH